MKLNSFIKSCAVLISCSLISADISLAGLGGRGGGGGGGFRGGGGGGGISRPSGGGGARPSGNISRPNISAPKPNISRPSQPISRPSIPSAPSSRPNISRPSGGLKPSTLPGNLPSSRPSMPNIQKPNIQRPNTSIPSFPNRPSTLPSMPGNRPSTLPGNLPNAGNNRPSLPGNGNRPSLPGNGNRPNLPGNGNRPNFPGNVPNPGNRPGGGGPRPTPGGLGDFLGMDKPLKPQTLPGNIPNRPGDITQLPNRPGNGNRPDFSNRPGNGNRPDWVNKPGSNNNIINNKPNWVNIDNSTNVNINNRWSKSIYRPGRPTTLPATRPYWNNWGSGVRHHWNYGRYDNCFNDRWWSNHYHGVAGWHYCHGYNRYPWNYWWRRPAWTAYGTWFVWANRYPQVWQQPVYYDYGSGGNVVYQDSYVYIDGQQIATADEFAMSAADLATVAPPADPQAAEQDTEWMPLGTFALSTGQNDTDPSRVVQLAVDRNGIVSGTLYNTQTDQTQTIQGKVDEQTQRVAFRIGDSETIVAETGLYNLTQDEVPLLVHFGTEKVENYLLVRLEEPAEGQAAQ